MIKINCDGGSRGNPGPAAYGFVVKEGTSLVKEGSGYIGNTTNNIAEYTAVVMALSWLKTEKPKNDLNFFLDSLLVVSQLNGIYKVKDARIRDLVVKVRELESAFNKVMYYHIPREQNSHADSLVNFALDNRE